MPIRVARFALDDQSPQADLYLSPKHALFVDGVLIPVKDLVNGVSIKPAMPRTAEIIEYFHILLSSHEVIWAEGTPVETLILRHGEHESFDNFVDFERLE
jgi:hypothetical protein